MKGNRKKEDLYKYLRHHEKVNRKMLQIIKF